METNYTVIFSDGSTTQHSHDLPERPGYKALASLISPLVGGSIERVRVWHKGEYLDMFVDEDGISRGKPENPSATEIYHANLRVHRPAEFKKMVARGALSSIRGVAVLFNRQVWF